jgi:hypothetical protein
MVDEKLLRNCLILLDKEFNIEKQKESTSIWVIKEELVSDPENFREGSHILNQYMSLSTEELDYIYATFALNVGIDYKNDKLTLPKLQIFDGEKTFYTTNKVVETFEYETYLPSMMGLFIYDHEIEPVAEEIVDTEFSDLEGVRVYDENGNATDV